MATGNIAQLKEAEMADLKPTVPKKESIIVFMSMFSWQGTVMPTALPVMLLSVGYAATVKVCLDKALDEGEEWSEFTTFYGGHVGVTTFFLVFFVGKCYGVYLEALGYCRGTQGRLQDLFLLTSKHAAAGTPQQIAKFRRYILAAPYSRTHARARTHACTRTRSYLHSRVRTGGQCMVGWILHLKTTPKMLSSLSLMLMTMRGCASSPLLARRPQAIARWELALVSCSSAWLASRCFSRIRRSMGPAWPTCKTSRTSS